MILLYFIILFSVVPVLLFETAIEVMRLIAAQFQA